MKSVSKPWKIGISYGVAFSGDGRLLATLAKDVSIWAVAERSRLVRARAVAHPCDAVFSPDGNSLAVKSTSGHIVILDARSGETIADFDNSDEGEGSNLQYSPCGDYIVDGSWNGCLTVRRAKTGAHEFVQEFAGEMIRGIRSFQSGQRWIVAHGPKATTDDRPPPPDYFSMWEWPFRRWPFWRRSHHVLPLRVAFSLPRSALTTDGQYLAVVHGAPPNTLSVFRLSDGSCVGTVPVEVGGTSGAVGWSHDGRLIGSVQDGAVVFYRWPDLQELRRVDLAFPNDAVFSPLGDLVALGSWRAGCVLASDALLTVA
jgi:WD40 repeat protein